MKASIFYVVKSVSSYIATRYQFKRVFRLSRNTNKMQLVIEFIIPKSEWKNFPTQPWQWPVTTWVYKPSIHPWRYSPFWALASLTRRLHSSLFVALLLHPLDPSTCSASLWTTFAHLVLGLPTGLVVWKFPFITFFGILSSSILIIWPAHSRLIILMSSTISGSLYKL